MNGDPVSEAFYARPILRVRDVTASLAYYRDRLGFQREWVVGQPPLVAQVSRSGST